MVITKQRAPHNGVRKICIAEILTDILSILKMKK